LHCPALQGGDKSQFVNRPLAHDLWAKARNRFASQSPLWRAGQLKILSGDTDHGS